MRWIREIERSLKMTLLRKGWLEQFVKASYVNHGNPLCNTLHDHGCVVDDTQRQVRRRRPIPRSQIITDFGHVGIRHQGLCM
jgi:hypothetical protein